MIFVRYLTWARQRHLELIDGEVTVCAYILDRIAQLKSRFEIREIAFDRSPCSSTLAFQQSK